MTTMTNTVTEKKLSKKDVLKAWARYYATAEVGNSYERLTAMAFGFGQAPMLEKLYGDNKEELRKAYQRHIQFYNSEGTWGSLVFGIALALEEEHANEITKPDYDPEQTDSFTDMVTNIKVGLMDLWQVLVIPLIWEQFDLSSCLCLFRQQQLGMHWEVLAH